MLPHLVLRVDEGVIDALGAVAEVEDGVDLLSTVERLGGSNLTHALRRDIFTICLCQNILENIFEEIFSVCAKIFALKSFTWNSSWERTMQQEVTRYTSIFSSLNILVLFHSNSGPPKLDQKFMLTT